MGLFHPCFGRSIALIALGAGIVIAPGAQIINDYTVTNTLDSGPGSLRQALTDAQNDFTESYITFFIPGDGPHTIEPVAQLPALGDGTVLDGSFEIGPNGERWVEISGRVGITFTHGIWVFGSGCLIRDLTLNQWGQSAIFLDTEGSGFVRGCRIGTDVTGNSQGVGAQNVGVFVDSPNNRIGGAGTNDGNVISGNDVGIWSSETGLGTVIQGNRIGTNLAGTGRIANGLGVWMAGSQSTIGGTAEGAGNLISGNDEAGIEIQGSNNVVEGNIIGLAADGVTRLGNVGSGIRIGMVSQTQSAAGNRIGGPAAGARNVISGNDLYGIEIVGLLSTGTVIQGNHIGVDVTGALGLGNRVSGVSNDESDGTQIGGTTPGAGNIISGNGAYGVFLRGHLGHVAGNRIGTDASGMAAVPNGLDGVHITQYDSAPGLNLVGGTTPGSRNLISGNMRVGVRLNVLNPEGTNNVVAGNWIGVDATGDNPLGNGEEGIDMFSIGDTIGGDTPETGNVISGNGGAGIISTVGGNRIQHNTIGLDPTRTYAIGNGGAGILGPNGAELLILDNAIGGNGGIGIDIDGDGPTPNDAPPDTDDVQNWPVMGAAHLSESPPRFTGLLQSAPNVMYTIQLFVSDLPDPSGYGEGQHPFFTFTTMTDATGLATWNLPYTGGAVPPGRHITGTATDANLRTSEFSPPVVANGRGPSPNEIVAHLLGLIPDPGGLDLNGSGTVEAGDVVTAVIAQP